MRYFKVDSEETAMKLSELIFSLMYTSDVGATTTHLFGWESNGTETVIRIPENYVCPVFIKDNFEEVVQEMATILNGAVAEGEGAALVEYLKTGQVILEKLIPSGLVEVDRQYLIDNKIIKIADI